MIFYHSLLINTKISFVFLHRIKFKNQNIQNLKQVMENIVLLILLFIYLYVDIYYYYY